MSAEVITAEDLRRFKEEVIKEIEALFIKHNKPRLSLHEGLRTKDVRKILCCSNGKLQMLRMAGKLHCKKIGGTLYYNRKEVEELIENGF